MESSEDFDNVVGKDGRGEQGEVKAGQGGLI